MTGAIRATMGGTFALNYYVHFCEDNGLIFFSNPVASAANSKASLNMAISELAGAPMEMKNATDVNARANNPMLAPNAVSDTAFGLMLEDPGFVKFCFVRDPATRVQAAYTGTLTRRTPNSGPRKQLFERLGLDLDRDLSIEDFALLVAEDSETRDLVALWRLQRRNIAFDLIDYDFIGRHESWEVDFGTVTTEIFGYAIRQFNLKSNFGFDEDNMRVSTELSSKTRSVLELAYAQDYEMLEEISELEFEITPQSG